MQLKKLDEAKECYERILEIDPENNDARNLLKNFDD